VPSAVRGGRKESAWARYFAASGLVNLKWSRKYKSTTTLDEMPETILSYTIITLERLSRKHREHLHQSSAEQVSGYVYAVDSRWIKDCQEKQIVCWWIISRGRTTSPTYWALSVCCVHRVFFRSLALTDQSRWQSSKRRVASLVGDLSPTVGVGVSDDKPDCALKTLLTLSVQWSLETVSSGSSRCGTSRMAVYPEFW